LSGDLSLPHVHGVGIVPPGRAEDLAAIDQMGSVDARRNGHDDGSSALMAEADNVDFENRWTDGP
jgi:hypothetical protein